MHIDCAEALTTWYAYCAKGKTINDTTESDENTDVMISRHKNQLDFISFSSCGRYYLSISHGYFFRFFFRHSQQSDHHYCHFIQSNNEQNQLISEFRMEPIFTYWNHSPLMHTNRSHHQHHAHMHMSASGTPQLTVIWLLRTDTCFSFAHEFAAVHDYSKRNLWVLIWLNFLFIHLQNSSKKCWLNRKLNSTRCSNAPTESFTNRIRMFSRICLMNSRIIISAGKLIWPKRWIRFSIHCTRKCSPYWMHNTNSTTSKLTSVFQFVIWICC